jgi:hypothetical protein
MSADLTWLIRPLALMTLIKNLGRHNHNLAIESLNYYNKVQTHSNTHTNVLKSTKIKF